MSELIPEDTTQTKVDQGKVEEQNIITTPDKPVEINEDPDWRAVREQRKADRKAREEAEKRAAEKAAEAEAMKAAMEALLNKSSPQTNNFFNENEETDQQRIAKEVEKALKQERIKYQQEAEQREKTEFPMRLRRDFPDFDKICDAENLDYLEYKYPEVAAPYKYMPDGYDKWASIYRAAKKFVPNIDIKKENAKIDHNLSKPGSVSSSGTTQPNSGKGSHILTEKQKQENWERMTQRMKGLS